MIGSRRFQPRRLAAVLADALALAGCQQFQNLAGAGTVRGGATGGVGPSAGGTATAARTDPDMSRVISALTALGAQPIESLSVERARRQPSFANAYRRVLQERGAVSPPGAAVRTRDIAVPGPAGPIPARLYAPAQGGSGAQPLIVCWHGGGWVIADLDTYDASARALAAETGAVVLSAHYRQAPEHRFPAAHEDAFATHRWGARAGRAVSGQQEAMPGSGYTARSRGRFLSSGRARAAPGRRASSSHPCARGPLRLERCRRSRWGFGRGPEQNSVDGETWTTFGTAPGSRPSARTRKRPSNG